jgi:hypothetical protein
VEPPCGEVLKIIRIRAIVKHQFTKFQLKLKS